MPQTRNGSTLLGEGSFGRVEKVLWGNQWYACKRMLKDQDDEGLTYAALRECDVYSRFASPFMIPVYRTSIDNHCACLWMGLADMSLAQYIFGNPAFSDRLRLAEQLLWSALNFLHYLHSYNVLHRDIKPDNILLQKASGSSDSGASETWNVYVSDMGSCRWFQRGLQLTGGMGTRCFRPPEMDSSKYGKAGDIYGLAVTTISLLHGTHPVEGQNPATTPSQWQQTLRVYQPYISRAMYDLLRRMVLSKPQDRVSVSDALAHEFFQDTKIPSVPKMIAVPYPGYYWTRCTFAGSEERRGWIETMIDIGSGYGFNAYTLVHAVHLYDDFWSASGVSATPATLELYAYVAVWIAGKYFEEYAMPLCELVQYGRGRFTMDDFIDAEERLVTALNFRLVRRAPQKPLTQRANVALLKQVLGAPEYTVGQFIPKKSVRLACKTRAAAQRVF